jgi:uncharacterized protein DUF4365
MPGALASDPPHDAEARCRRAIPVYLSLSNAPAMSPPYSPIGFRGSLTPATSGFPGLDHLKNNFREWYSWAVVASVASGAGLICHIPSIDANKTDVRVETVSLWQGRQRSIRLQLKASSDIGTARVGGVDYVTHSLDRDYYDEMQEPSTVPLFLVLVALPPLANVWTRIRPSIVVLIVLW